MADSLQRRGQPVSLLSKLLRALLALLVVAGAALGGLWAAAHNEAATATMLAWVPGLTVTEPQGALIGDFSASRIEVRLPRGGRLTLLAPAWKGLSMHADAQASWHLGFTVASLRARRLDLVWVADPVVTPTVAPTSLSLPVSLRLARVQLDEAHSALWGEQPLMALDASLVLGSPGKALAGGVQHRLQLDHLGWGGWRVQGAATVGASGRLPVDLALDLRQVPGVADAAQAASAPVSVPAPAPTAAPAPVQAQLRLKGPLADLSMAGDAHWQGLPDAQGVVPAPQSLSLSGLVRPFAPWPLPRLAVQAQALNLAALWPGLPRTHLAGELSLAPDGADDLLLKVALDNALAGPWDMGALPLKVVKGSLRGREALKATSLGAFLRSGEVAMLAELPSLKGLAPGQLGLNGHWRLADAALPGAKTEARQSASSGTTELTLKVEGLTPQALDGRAPPLRLQGLVTLRPRWERGQATATPSSFFTAILAELSGEVGPAFLAAGAKPWLGLSAQPVSLSLDAELGAQALTVRKLGLVSQAQQAVLSQATVRWGEGGKAAQVPWSAAGQLKVEGFDPRVWFPWPEAVTGHNQLGGEANFDLDGRGLGQLDARLSNSTLGGLPVSGQVAWLAKASGAAASLKLDLDAAGNQVHAQGAWPLRAQGTNPIWSPATPGQQWQLDIKAVELDRLQTLAPLLGLSRLAGEVQAQGHFTGQWPGFDSQGELTVRHLQWQPSPAASAPAGQVQQVDEAQGTWHIDTRSLDAPLSARLKVQGGHLGGLLIGQSSVVLEGTGKAHRIQLDADASRLLKTTAASARTAVTDARPGQATPDSTFVGQALHLSLGATGAGLSEWQGWQGQVSELRLQTTKTPTQTVLAAQPFPLGVKLTGAHRQGLALALGPARLDVMGADLQLHRLSGNWPEPADGAQAARADQGEVDVQMQLLPLNLSSVLARWQPQNGWGGDLLVGGVLRVQHSAGRPWEVDALVNRQSGDLTLSEPTIEGNSQQRLGIREARIALQARNGVWSLSELFEGRVLGQVSGRQVVQAVSPDRLPAASDALTGALDLQIGSLRPWAVWVPAGWRLSGQLQAQATLAGTLGTPQYRGQVKGQNLGLGQALLGVNLTDGQLAMELEGARARLTRFDARDGSLGGQGGTVHADGEAELAEQPRATLRVQAERFALLQRVDRRVVVSADLKATLAEQDIVVDGRVGVDEGLIDISRSDAPTVGDDVNVLNGPGKTPQEDEDAAKASNGKRKMAASVNVDLGRKLRLRGRGIDTLLTGALRFTTPNNRPTLSGVVKTEQGTFAAYGQKLRIERGTITFNGPIENPRLDILAMRPQSGSASSIVSQTDVKVGVSITGTALDPRVSLYSDPTLTETEKLSWLVLGRAPTGLGGADIGLLQTAAVALLSGEKASPTDKLIGLLGLDEISVRQSDNTTVRETVVNVGKQVSKFWYVGYERNLNATGGSWQLIYRLGQRLTLRAQAGQDNALDLIRSWRWD
jgi:translocation and assembly module TamB